MPTLYPADHWGASIESELRACKDGQAGIAPLQFLARHRHGGLAQLREEESKLKRKLASLQKDIFRLEIAAEVDAVSPDYPVDERQATKAQDRSKRFCWGHRHRRWGWGSAQHRAFVKHEMRRAGRRASKAEARAWLDAIE